MIKHINTGLYALAVRLGGHVNNGANYGVLIFNANNAPSNVNWNYGGEIFPTPSPAGHYALAIAIKTQRILLRILFRGWQQLKLSDWNGLVIYMKRRVDLKDN